MKGISSGTSGAKKGARPSSLSPHASVSSTLSGCGICKLCPLILAPSCSTFSILLTLPTRGVSSNALPGDKINDDWWWLLLRRFWDELKCSAELGMAKWCCSSELSFPRSMLCKNESGGCSTSSDANDVDEALKGCAFRFVNPRWSVEIDGISNGVSSGGVGSNLWLNCCERIPLLELVEELWLLETTAIVGVGSSGTFKRPDEGGGPLGEGPPLELLAKELVATTDRRVPTNDVVGFVAWGDFWVPTFLKLCEGLKYAGLFPWPEWGCGGGK